MSGMQIARLVAVGTTLLSTAIGLIFTSKSMKGMSHGSCPDPDSFDGKTLSGSSGNVRGNEFTGILRFQVNDKALLVSSSFPPRFATLLTLSKLHGVCKRSLFFKYVYLTYEEDASFKMRISKSIADQIQKYSYGSWLYS
ncbi:hypothetical protein [Rhodanobacter sp. DHB23]|uniref:hypothetical protein n=1 Tax=Rhodanobacter sp. DHB23 TaxID=2775923 RepID=UPI001786DECE|nr:hypothetical protein [Rhodanobacter sp. DHB23]MBD8871507.1 hypothetical protein [Rhodanobacter sp. DHB23]